MRFDPSTLPARDVYQLMIGLITPRPIAWISTLSAEGVPNLAPFSFFSGVGANPPTVVFSCVDRRDGTPKDTVRNLRVVPEFVVSAASFDQRVAVNETSAEFDYEVDEFAACGLTPVASEQVRPPRVGESRAHLECVVHQIVRVGDGPLAANLVIGRIVMVHADDAIVTAEGQIDAHKLDTIGRMGGASYARTTELFELPRPSGVRR
ncbi:MAG: flavin reductase family protein [Myxococcales bacterium]|nr:flavin reductase family protein [Myxococcales bacterium]